MGCPSKCKIGSNLVFSVDIHDPETAEHMDADSVPIYRVYENETTTPILTGSMSKLDDSNTTGFYSELIACTVANGFEADKTYTVYISAAVGGISASTSYSFIAEESLEGVNGVTITCQEPDTTPIADVYVTVRNSDESLIVGNGITDSNGELSISLNNGTYKIRFFKTGFNFTNPQTLVVDENGETLLVEGTAISPVSGLQTFYGYIVNIIGEFDDDVSVQATRIIDGQVINNQILSSEILSTTVDVNGYFTLQLIKGAKVIVKLIRDSDVMDEKSFTVSSSDSADWSDY